jgi:hypothetical protein
MSQATHAQKGRHGKKILPISNGMKSFKNFEQLPDNSEFAQVGSFSYFNSNLSGMNERPALPRSRESSNYP